MTIMIISLLLLVCCIAGPSYYSRLISGYVKEVRRIEREKASFAVAVEELEADVNELMTKESELHRERTAMIEITQALPSLGGQGASPGGDFKTPIEYLLSIGRITEEDVRKAKKFKEGSKSPYGLEEVLLMMDAISSSDLKSALAVVKDKD